MKQGIETKIDAAAAAGPKALIDLWAGWQGTGEQTPESGVLVAEALIGMARPGDALAVLQHTGDGTRSRQLRALALSKAGHVDRAIEALAALRAEGLLDAETGGLLGGRYKERGLAHDNAADLQAAYQVYLETYERSGDGYPGINAAALALWLGEREESARIAAEVLEKVTLPPEQMDAWTFATRGEAHLLLGDLRNARTWYRRAVGANPNAVRNVATMRRQARADLTALGIDEHALDAVLVVRKVAAFTGHMIDEPGRVPSRFPPGAEGDVRLAIRERLKALAVGFGFSSAARGADLLFLEELLERGGHARVVLPFPYERFVQTSVGPEWQARCERVLADPRVTVSTLADQPPKDDQLEAAYIACSEEVAREATLFAKGLADEAVLLAVWDGKPGDGRGGTSDTIRAWQASGRRLEVIPPRGAQAATVDPATTSPPAPFPREVSVDPAGGDRGIGTLRKGARAPAGSFRYDNRHCLCVGIRDYQAPFTRLPNARHDAEAVGQVLAVRHGFADPIFLLDGQATAHAIAAAITSTLQERARENDLVVVYFAGHGYTMKMGLGGQEHGFIVPADAAGLAPAGLVSVSQLTDWSAYVESRHLLYIFDSCFSGMFQRMAGSDRIPPDTSRARLAITSGQADQVVKDGGADTAHSVFTDALLLALDKGIEGKTSYTANQLYSFLRERVVERFPEQTPTLATLRNHEGGEILFQLAR